MARGVHVAREKRPGRITPTLSLRLKRAAGRLVSAHRAVGLRCAKVDAPLPLQRAQKCSGSQAARLLLHAASHLGCERGRLANGIRVVQRLVRGLIRRWLLAGHVARSRRVWTE